MSGGYGGEEVLGEGVDVSAISFHALYSHLMQLLSHRDVENDETMFYLILPPDFKKQDADAEVFAMTRVGSHQVSYRSLRTGLGSIKEDEESTGGTGVRSPGGISKSPSDVEDNTSISSTCSKKKPRLSPFRKRGQDEEHEIIYQFRVLLDGNEKFIWLQAAAELGRLCNLTAINMVSTDIK